MSNALFEFFNFLAERIFKVDSKNLFEIPMQLLRKFTQLFIVSFGFLLLGIIGINFLLSEVYQQLLAKNSVNMTITLFYSSFIVLVSLIGCGLILQNRFWLAKEEIPVKAQKEQHMTELMSAIALLVTDIVQERVEKRQAQRAAVANQNLSESQEIKLA